MDSINQNMEDNEEKQRNQESSPPSSTSSPSHDFSFTISFQQTKQIPPSSSPFAIDLSPADDIFFHGHLLPLHLLSHLPVSPRSSTDSFTLPIKNMFQNPNNQTVSDDNKGKTKPKSFSLFGLPKRRKEVEKENKEKQRKVKFDVTRAVKRYIRMVKPFLSFRSRKNIQFHREAYSYSGNLNLRGKNEEMRGQYSSAPASMRTSPTNSGLLVATPLKLGVSPNSSSSSSSSRDSTMEELQAAIQAAIAHCKQSFSMDDKVK